MTGAYTDPYCMTAVYPDAPVTREQMAVLLDRLFGDDPVYQGAIGLAPFSDADPSREWSYGAICRMAARGFIKGFQDGTFRPYEAISRGQMAVLAERAFPSLAGNA